MAVKHSPRRLADMTVMEFEQWMLEERDFPLVGGDFVSDVLANYWSAETGSVTVAWGVEDQLQLLRESNMAPLIDWREEGEENLVPPHPAPLLYYEEGGQFDRGMKRVLDALEEFRLAIETVVDIWDNPENWGLYRGQFTLKGSNAAHAFDAAVIADTKRNDLAQLLDNSFSNATAYTLPNVFTLRGTKYIPVDSIRAMLNMANQQLPEFALVRTSTGNVAATCLHNMVLKCVGRERDTERGGNPGIFRIWAWGQGPTNKQFRIQPVYMFDRLKRTTKVHSHDMGHGLLCLGTVKAGVEAAWQDLNFHRCLMLIRQVINTYETQVDGEAYRRYDDLYERSPQNFLKCPFTDRPLTSTAHARWSPLDRAWCWHECFTCVSVEGWLAKTRQYAESHPTNPDDVVHQLAGLEQLHREGKKRIWVVNRGNRNMILLPNSGVYIHEKWDEIQWDPPTSEEEAEMEETGIVEVTRVGRLTEVDDDLLEQILPELEDAPPDEMGEEFADREAEWDDDINDYYEDDVEYDDYDAEEVDAEEADTF